VKSGKFTLLRACFVLFFISGTSFAWYLGEKSFYIAYNSCIDDGAKARTALENYKVTHFEYPESLAQLNIDLPCARVINGTILQYKKTEAGYKLSFSDWLVTHRANQDEDFFAIK
jgi:hypothetical protein